MAKPKSNPLTIILTVFIVCILIVITAILTRMYYGGGITINEAGETLIVPEEGSTFNLGDYFTDNFPDYFNLVEENCGLAGGRWVESPTAIGCYNIPDWDYLHSCTSDDVKNMKAMCIIAKGIYTCDAHEASCEI